MREASGRSPDRPAGGSVPYGRNFPTNTKREPRSGSRYFTGSVYFFLTQPSSTVGTNHSS